MKTEEEIKEERDRIIALLEAKRADKNWTDYEYYEERLYALDWVLDG